MNCFITTRMDLRDLPTYDLAVIMCATVFGPMRGTYHGVYPSRHEAYLLLDASEEEISLADFSTGSYEIEGTEVELEKEAVDRFFSWVGHFNCNRDDSGSVRLAIVNEECLIVGYRTRYQEDCWAVSLIDIKGSTAFAHYVLQDKDHAS